MKTLTLTISKGRLTHVPVWTGDRRGSRTWCAVIDKHPTRARQVEREFLPKSKGVVFTYAIGSVRLNDPLEFGADNESPRRRIRLYGVVTELTSEHLVLEVCSTAASAIERSRELQSERRAGLRAEAERLRARLREIEDELDEPFKAL